MKAPEASINEDPIVLVRGKFAPLHAGSVMVLDFARGLGCGQLWILLDDCDSVVEAELKRCLNKTSQSKNELALSSSFADCITEAAPGAKLFRLSETDNLEELLPGRPDVVVGSDAEDRELADRLNCAFIPVDPQRGLIPVQGKSLRQDPLNHWQWIYPGVRSQFVRRVCIFGPESTGKSTLARNLAEHFNTVSVPEWARTMLESRDNELREEDLPIFARGHAALEDAMAREADRLLFCDTDAITTLIWSEWLYEGRCHPEIRRLADERLYDLYLLTDVDVPWVDDPQRYLPTKRKEFHQRCVEELNKREIAFVEIKGGWDERLATAIAAVEAAFLPEKAVRH